MHPTPFLAILATCALRSLAQTITVTTPGPGDPIPNRRVIIVDIEQNSFDGTLTELSPIIGLIPTQTSGSTTGPGEIIYNGPFSESLEIQIPDDLPDGTNTLTVFHMASTVATGQSETRILYDFQSIPVELVEI